MKPWRRPQPQPGLHDDTAAWIAARAEHHWPGAWWIPLLREVLTDTSLTRRDYLLLFVGADVAFGWYDTVVDAEKAAAELGPGQAVYVPVADEIKLCGKTMAERITAEAAS